MCLNVRFLSYQDTIRNAALGVFLSRYYFVVVVFGFGRFKICILFIIVTCYASPLHVTALLQLIALSKNSPLS